MIGHLSPKMAASNMEIRMETDEYSVFLDVSYVSYALVQA